MVCLLCIMYVMCDRPMCDVCDMCMYVCMYVCMYYACMQNMHNVWIDGLREGGGLRVMWVMVV